LSLQFLKIHADTLGFILKFLPELAELRILSFLELSNVMYYAELGICLYLLDFLIKFPFLHRKEMYIGV